MPRLERILFKSEQPKLTITIKAVINDNALGVIGHDSGEIVKGIKGQTGYLYEVWTQDNSLELFMQKLSVAEGINFDPETLMDWLAKNYNTENADKEIGKLLETHGIRVGWFFD